MTIFLAGASGFIGERVLEDLKGAGHRVIAHVHSDRSREAILRQYPDVSVVQADLSDPKQVHGIVPKGTDAIIFLPGVLRESKGLSFEGIHVTGVKNLLHEAASIGVRRWVQMSALGAAANGSTIYYRTKWQAEELLRQSGLDITIIRPSLVFDDRPRRQHSFVSEILKAIKQAPVIPILGNGKFLLQPVSVDDVSQTCVQSLSRKETVGKTYELGGPQTMTYTEIVNAIARAANARKPRVHIPIAAITALATLLDWLPFLPITRDEIRMLTEGNYIRDKEKEREWRQAFDLPLKPFKVVV
jgi:uncharacterized protein YbjT (DUF2867 family)